MPCQGLQRLSTAHPELETHNSGLKHKSGVSDDDVRVPRKRMSQGGDMEQLQALDIDYDES